MILLVLVIVLSWLLRKSFGVRNAPHQRYLDVFTEQLASFVKANLPVAQSVEAIPERWLPRKSRRTHEEVRMDLAAGAFLSEALARHPAVFPGWYVSLLKAGEESGDLAGAFEQISTYREAMMSLWRKLSWPLGYFMALMVILLVYSLFMKAFIWPTFTGMLGALTAHPITPLFVLGSFWSAHWLTVAIIVILLFVFAPVARLLRREFSAMRFFFDTAALRTPFLGRLMRKAVTVRIARTLGVLLRAGVPLPKALEMTADTGSNVVAGKVLGGLADRVREGEPLGLHLERTRLFPRTFVWMVGVGEESGRLDEALLEAADYFDMQLDASFNAVTSIALPAAVLLGGAFVGLLAVSTFDVLITISESLF